jgi:hypothetical protein
MIVLSLRSVRKGFGSTLLRNCSAPSISPWIEAVWLKTERSSVVALVTLESTLLASSLPAATSPPAPRHPSSRDWARGPPFLLLTALWLLLRSRGAPIHFLCRLTLGYNSVSRGQLRLMSVESCIKIKPQQLDVSRISIKKCTIFSWFCVMLYVEVSWQSLWVPWTAWFSPSSPSHCKLQLSSNGLGMFYSATTIFSIASYFSHLYIIELGKYTRALLRTKLI